MQKSTTVKILTIALLLSVMLTGTTYGYYNWDRGIIKISGAAAMSAKTRSPKGAFIKGRLRQAARLDAARLLTELLNGITVETLANPAANLDVIHTKSTGTLGKIKMKKVAESFEGGGCSADFEVPMFGDSDSVAAWLYSANGKPSPFPAPRSALPTIGNYTGVIIDCRNLNFSPTFFPVIDDGDRVIFSCQNIDRATLIKSGPVGYAKDMGNTARAGKNPLVIRAIAYDKDKERLQIAADAADRLLSENARTGFLSRGAMVLLY